MKYGESVIMIIDKKNMETAFCETAASIVMHGRGVFVNNQPLTNSLCK
jgi:hypothetical protein